MALAILHVRLDIIGTDNFFAPKEKPTMKKLMTLMLGLSLAFGTVTAAFAQDTTKKVKPKTKGKKKKTDTTKG